MIRRAASLVVLLALAACAHGPRIQATPSPTTIPAAPARGEPRGYTGLGGTQLRAMFGEPAFIRQDGATQMWRYDGSACKAFFFLYGQPGAVRHVETLPRGAFDAADTGCLSALRVSPAKTS